MILFLDIFGFIPFSLIKLIDILLVALLLFQLYMLIKGTNAIRIFIGISTIYILWKIVQILQMELLSEILGQFIGVGVLALIIVFQQEIRRFLIMIGNTRFLRRGNRKWNIFNWRMQVRNVETIYIKSILKACKNMVKTKTGALIIIAKEADISQYTLSGQQLDAKISSALLESIFFKNSPLHDGAAIISGNRILAARCVLPITEKEDLPTHFGLRHRAAIGISEISDAISIVISEETSSLSFIKDGETSYGIEIDELKKLLENELIKLQ
jgi:uncharacterized protein (TIGR00159 family)